MACESCGDHLCIKTFDGLKHRWHDGCLELWQDSEATCADGPCGPGGVGGCLEDGKTSLFVRNECPCARTVTLIIQAEGTGTIRGDVFIDNQLIPPSSSPLIPRAAHAVGSSVVWIANYVLHSNGTLQAFPVYTGTWPNVHYQLVFN